MNKYILGISGMVLAGIALAAPQALYVKKGDSFTKYNYGVAGDLKFSDNGHKLSISGYGDVINLDEIDYISFNAPVDAGALTPYMQKQKMIEVGESVNALIDQKSVADVLRLQDAFFAHHDIPNGTFHPACELDLPEEFRGEDKWVEPDIANIASIAQGDPSAIRALRSNAVKLYTMSKYFGVYAADNKEMEWVKQTDADYLEILFEGYDGTPYSVRLDCSTAKAEWSVEDRRFEIPEKMTMTFKASGKKVAEVVIDSRISQDEQIKMTLTATASGYLVVNAFEVTDKEISDKVTLYVNGKECIASNSRINGAKLLDYEIMKDDVKEATHYHDEDGNCMGDEPEALIAHFYRARTDLDVLGMLQVKANALGFSRLYDILTEDDDDSIYNPGWEILSCNSDKSVITVTYTTAKERKEMERTVDHLNTYADAQFFYDGKKEMQGFLSFEMQEDEWAEDFSVDGAKDRGYIIRDNRLISVSNWGDGWAYWGDSGIVTVPASEVLHPAKVRYVDYYVAPLLTFPDMTSYAFEDFFTGSSFRRLINDYDAIIDTYLTVTDQK